MDELIPIINKLQDVFNAIGQSSINLPQIVVIGSQSSGKSSVLENIVGRDFLPRGTGIVTRRPLVLQLYNIPISSSSGTYENNEEYGEFLHLPGKKFTDFNEIRTEIIKETDRLSGKNKNISSKSINLRIYSPNVLNLTLVDLPGITKVPIGDQPHNIEEEINNLCFQYISNSNSIILAVTAANTDLTNSDSLKLARKVDPNGLRTLGVLTKLDLMDTGTDALDMLNGNIISLKRGFIGLINRSQSDINSNVTIKESLHKESAFFNSHPVYKSIAKRLGSRYLTKELNKVLINHIKECLPDLKTKISYMLANVEKEIDEMGKPLASMSTTQLGGMLLSILSRFASNFCSCIEGKYHQIISTPYSSTTSNSLTSGSSTASSPRINMLNNTMNLMTNSMNSLSMKNELFGGARINYIFNEVFLKIIDEISPFDHLTDADIRMAIRNANGTRQSLFVPEISFELLVKSQICRLESPGLQCVDLVFDELQYLTVQCETSELLRFTELRDKAIEVVSQMLREYLIPTRNMISNLIKIELAYINTNHPDFIGGSKAIAQLMEKLQDEKWRLNDTTNSIADSNIKDNTSIISKTDEKYINETKDGTLNGWINDNIKNKSHEDKNETHNKKNIEKTLFSPISMKCSDELTDRERIETEIIKSLIVSYFDIVKKNYIDLVPKSIMCLLVKSAKENIQNKLVSSLYREDMLPELLKESNEMIFKRSNCEEMRILLRKAMDIVNEVRDFNIFNDRATS